MKKCAFLFLLLLSACAGSGDGQTPTAGGGSQTNNCNKHFLFVAGFSANQVTSFDLNRCTGQSTSITNAPLSANTFGPNSIAASADGKFLYTANYAGTVATNNASVSVLSVRDDGVLNEIQTLQIANGIGYGKIAISPNGKFVYVSLQDKNLLMGYSVDSTTGMLTALAGFPIATLAEPSGLAFTSNSATLYVAKYAAGKIRGYTINQTTGALTQVTEVTTTGPYTLKIDPNGTRLYAGSFSNNQTVAYTIGVNGVLSAIAGFPVASGASPSALQFHTAANYLYVANYNSPAGITRLDVNPTTGALTNATLTAFAGSQLTAMTFFADANLLIALDRSGAGGRIYSLSANPTTGALTTQQTISLTNPHDLVITNR